MDEYIVDQALLAYERIEEALSGFSEQVPFVRRNESMESPFLIPYIMEACGLLDSVLRDMTPDPTMVEGKTKKRKDCDIRDFAILHSKALDLANTRSILMVSPPRYCRPFEKWSKLIGDYKPLPWWSDYNSLKHDRLLHIHKATLRTAVDSCCALQQVIARRLDLVPMLIRRGWLSSGHYDIGYVVDEAKQRRLPDTFIVQTRLFATTIGKLQFPRSLTEVKPAIYQCKTEFIAFIGKTYV